jgi:hypothetical protein
VAHPGQYQEVENTAWLVLHALAPGLFPCPRFEAIHQFTVGMHRPQALLPITIASVTVIRASTGRSDTAHGTSRSWACPAAASPPH